MCIENHEQYAVRLLRRTLFIQEALDDKKRYFRQTRTRTVFAQRWNTPATTSFAQQLHAREGRNPGRVTVHGETISRNGQEPGREEGQSKAIAAGEIYGTIRAWTGFPPSREGRRDVRGNDVVMFAGRTT
jgi:hypothetical protein